MCGSLSPLCVCVCVLQVEKDVRHPLLLEQPFVQAAVSLWLSDYELQEILRKGERPSLFQCSSL